MLTKFIIQPYDMQNMVDMLWTPTSFHRILLPLPFNLIPKKRKTKFMEDPPDQNEGPTKTNSVATQYELKMKI